MKTVTAASLLAVSVMAVGDDLHDRPDLAAETFCIQQAAALRVQVRALGLLRKYPADTNQKVIHYLELQSGINETALKHYSVKPECQTDGVTSALDELALYRAGGIPGDVDKRK